MNTNNSSSNIVNVQAKHHNKGHHGTSRIHVPRATYRQGRRQAKKDAGLSRGRLFKSLIGHNHKILNHKYEDGYEGYMSTFDDVGDYYFDMFCPTVKSAFIYLHGNRMTKRAVWAYCEHNGKSNKKLMRKNRQYRRAFNKVENIYDEVD